MRVRRYPRTRRTNVRANRSSRIARSAAVKHKPTTGRRLRAPSAGSIPGLRYDASVAPSKEEVAQAVRQILETDLKFAGMELPDELAMVGDGLMLDSLDLLMLVTGLEKRFGHKIAKGKLGPKTMANIGTFIDFAHVELRQASA